MTERASRRVAVGTRCLLAILVVLSFVTSGDRILVAARPEPLQPGFIYGDNFADDPESFMLLSRLKQLTEQKHRVVEQEHEITDEQIEIQAVLEAKERERQRAAFVERPPPEYSAEDTEPEALPIPAAMIHHGDQHTGKRHGNNAVSYMSLCHFKICNMGRKRQHGT